MYPQSSLLEVFIMNKSAIIIFLSVLLINGCSSINTSPPTNPELSANSPDEANFLSDIFAQFQEQPETESKKETESVLQSTRLVLQSTPEVTQQIIEQKIEQNRQQLHFDDVWKRITSSYQLSAIDNKRIHNQQDWFLRHKKTIEKISERAIPFLYFITEEVNKRKMPGEIALLPIIESSFKTNAYSRMKAAGLWQFVPATGRHFGLKQNWWYDGRRDVYQSTLAALTYLEQLHKYYKGDWLLALAAYNAGAGTINRAIRKNIKKGKPIDYWSLPLPRETARYIPKLLAISRIIDKHEQYNISLSPINNQPHLMLINTQSQIDLAVAAKMAGLSLKEIQTYNPAFKQWATDPNGPHHLLIPINKAAGFEQKLALLDKKDRVKWYRHKIRSGESLSVIARHYRISVKLLKQANKLKNSRIRAGKYLMVPQNSNAKTLLASNQPRKKQTKRVVSASNSKYFNYTVQRGDSFWKIARYYNVSHKKLATINHYSSGDTLSIGQTLLIPQTIIAENKSTREISYKVKSGDSLYTISRQFKVTINELTRWNNLNIKKYLKPGQQLRVFIVKSQSS